MMPTYQPKVKRDIIRRNEYAREKNYKNIWYKWEIVKEMSSKEWLTIPKVRKNSQMKEKNNLSKKQLEK